MRICFFGSDLAFKGGIQNLSANLIKHVSQRDEVDEILILCDGVEEDIYKSLNKKKVHIHRIGRINKGDMIRIFRRNVRYVHSNGDFDGFDVFHVLDDRAFPFLSPDLRPLIVTIHDDMKHEFLLQLKTLPITGIGGIFRIVDHYLPQLLLERLSVTKANAIVVNCDVVAERLKKHYGRLVTDKVRAIPPGFDHKKFNPHFMSKSDAKKCLKLDRHKVLVHVGGDKTSSRRKGLPYILGALEHMRKLKELDKRDILLIIIGETDKRWFQRFPRLRERIIEFPFLEEQMLSIVYRAADAFLMPSISEGWGIALVQALACGTSVIASKYVPSAISTKDTGVVHVEDKVNVPAQFAKSILEVLDNDPPTAKEWVKIFNWLVNNYSWERISERQIDLYWELIDGQGALA